MLADRGPSASPRLGGARVAFYLGVDIEHYALDRRSTSISPATVGLVPDPMNYGWRDYGPGVGIWRLTDLLDRLEIRASILLNAAACNRYPHIIDAAVPTPMRPSPTRSATIGRVRCTNRSGP